MQTMIRNKGKGLYISSADFASSYVLPYRQHLMRYVSMNRLKYYDRITPFQFATLIGIPDEKLIVTEYMDERGVIPEDKLKGLFAEDWYINNTADYVINAYHTLFEAENGYKKGSFRSCKDIYGHIMIYADVEFPFDSIQPSLQLLTSQMYLRQLKDFLCRVTGDRKYMDKTKLDECVEYSKMYIKPKKTETDGVTIRR